MLLILTTTLAACGGGGDAGSPGGGTPSTIPPPTITPPTSLALLAGNFDGRGNVDGTGLAARFSGPEGVAVDSAGNVYVADSSNSTIRKITPVGVVTTFAGLAGASGSVDGTGSAARFLFPRGIAVDNAGNVYVAEGDVRKITPAGVVTTLAGTAQGIVGADGVAVDSAGNVYVADFQNNTILKITPTKVVTTVAGTAGTSGSADGTGSAARFSGPEGVAVDSAGNVYVADSSNSTIRKITPVGVVTTLSGSPGISGSADGPIATAQFNHPGGITIDNAGSLYVADLLNNTIRKITPAGMVTTMAGTQGITGFVDGTATSARFHNPNGVAIDSAGTVYVADYDNQAIRKMTPTGVVTTLAGTAIKYGSTDGAGAAAQFSGPNGLATDGAGNVYIADVNNSTIRKITPAGMVSTFAGAPSWVGGSSDGTGAAAQFNKPEGIAIDSAGTFYVADTGSNTVRKITATGVVTTLAGTAGVSGSNDGVGSAAQFDRPTGIAVGATGVVYVADSQNKTIRKITTAGVVTTLAGTAGGFGWDDGFGAAARFLDPQGVAIDGAGNLYVTENNRIRKITPAGMVTTLAGVVGGNGSDDGSGAMARFTAPSGVVADSAGNVYVADTYNNTIRKINVAGLVTTVVGVAGRAGDQRGALPGYITHPKGLAKRGKDLYFTSQSGVAVVYNVP